MVNPFQIVAERLRDLGFFDFFIPWVMTSALLYALLRKSKIFGDDAIVINSVLSISVSFFTWGFIVLAGGGGIGAALSKFVTEIVLIGIGFLFIVLIAGIFIPDLKDLLSTLPNKGATFLIIALVIGVTLMIGSGLFNLGSAIYNLLSAFGKVPGGDAGLLIVAILILVLLLIIISIVR